MNMQPPIDAKLINSRVAKGRLNRERRRQVILEKTFAVLARQGAEGTTLRSVCREMGVAPSLMTRFFSGWHDLVLAAHQMIADRCLAELESVLKAPYARERRRAREVVRCCLNSRWGGASAAAAMTALWQMSRTMPDLRSDFEQFLNARRLLVQEAIARLAAEAGTGAPVEEVTTALLFLVDGVWMHRTFSPDSVADHASVDMCWGWLVERLGMPDWRLDTAGAAKEPDAVASSESGSPAAPWFKAVPAACVVA